MTLWLKGDAVRPAPKNRGRAESDSQTWQIFPRNCPFQSALRYESTRRANHREQTPRVPERQENGAPREAKSVLFWLKSNLRPRDAQRPSCS